MWGRPWLGFLSWVLGLFKDKSGIIIFFIKIIEVFLVIVFVVRVI